MKRIGFILVAIFAIWKNEARNFYATIHENKADKYSVVNSQEKEYVDKNK